MHFKGTAKEADVRNSTAGIIQTVSGNSALPARAWGAASTLPQPPTVRAMDTPSRLQPVSTSARSPAEILGRENASVNPQVPGVTPGKSTSDEIAKVTIDVKQTST